jgi:hypothetical protein
LNKKLFYIIKIPHNFAFVNPSDGQARPPRYLRQPFSAEPDFGVTSLNYDLKELLARSELPG